jgi:hypothetical protein
MAAPDCLVLKIEEYVTDVIKDTTVYVFYDKRKEEYVIRGQRRQTTKYQSCTYSFTCKKASDLVEFFDYILCWKSKISDTLYNYDNFSEDSNKITFEFLSEYDDESYEIVGYDKVSQCEFNLLSRLRVLRNVTNEY